MVESSTLNTVAGYAVIFAIGAALYLTQKPKKPAPPQPRTVQEPSKEKGTNKKKERAEKARQEAREKPRQEPAPASYAASKPDSGREADLDNAEFARQLSSLQEGTKFVAKSSKDQQRQKSIKQSRAEEKDFDEGKPSPPSSTGGIDADDDQSPAQSPETVPADAAGVADMLEAPASGPASLRLVDTDTGKLKQKPKKEKAPEPAETKKQRQNKKKAEAAKIAREEAEKERKVKMEAQRRTARLAEGRPAKDGSAYTNAAVNGSNAAWKEGAPKSADNSAAPAVVQPLDTFEQEPEMSAAPVKPAEKDWVASLPSEEEQMEQLKEWSTVKSSKSRKAKKNTSPAPAEKTEEAAAPQAPASKTVQEPKTAPATTNGKPKTQSYGSFTALSMDEPEEEQEVEWDV